MYNAYKGEQTDHFNYSAYNKKAVEEGHPEIVLLFTTSSRAELIHAGNHKVVLLRLGETVSEIIPKFTVKSTTENLQEAIAGERYEFNRMNPKIIKNASVTGNYMAQISLTYAYKGKQKHPGFHVVALSALEAGKDNTLSKIFFLCPFCGNTYALQHLAVVKFPWPIQSCLSR